MSVDFSECSRGTFSKITKISPKKNNEKLSQVEEKIKKINVFGELRKTP